MVEPASPDELSQLVVSDEEGINGTRAGSSAKIDQLVRLLQLTPVEEKSLVFSQFTSFLDKVRILRIVTTEFKDDLIMYRLGKPLTKLGEFEWISISLVCLRTTVSLIAALMAL